MKLLTTYKVTEYDDYENNVEIEGYVLQPDCDEEWELLNVYWEKQKYLGTYPDVDCDPYELASNTVPEIMTGKHYSSEATWTGVTLVIELYYER